MLSVEEYYVVEVHGAEWQYVVQERVILTIKDRVPEDAILSLEMSYPVYYLRRDKFPAELLARSFGGQRRADYRSQSHQTGPVRGVQRPAKSDHHGLGHSIKEKTMTQTPIERALERAAQIELDGSAYDKATAALFRELARDLEVQHEIIKAQRAEIDQWETDHHELIAEC